MGQLKDLTGQTFGRLTVLEIAGNNKHRQTYWICQCSCGKQTKVLEYNLIQGKTKSCGCLIRESHYIKHNGKKEYPRLYRIWKGMRQRCNNPSSAAYKDYGGRGISICEEWEEGFVNFRDWALANGYQDNLTIDRIDPDGNYCPENCHWITRKQQNDNKRDTIKFSHNGEFLTLSEWSKKYNINYQTLYDRIFGQKMSFEEAITKKPRKKHLLTYQGETKTLKEWSKITGISYDALFTRQRAGKTPEEILSLNQH